jgi:hypothetical protein
MNESFENRREHKRCAVKIPLEINNENLSADKSHTLDISIGGICAYCKNSFPMDSKVRVTLSIPIEEEFDVKKIKLIGEVVRVKEEPTASGANAVVGIKLLIINEHDMSILQDFLKRKYSISKVTKKISKDSKDFKDYCDSIDDMKTNGLEAEITPVNISELSFFERLQLRDDYSDIFTKFAKYFFITTIFALFLYISYYLFPLILKLINLR